ncbi:MAG: hypothetical protein HYV27_09235 [Candidatus Hydrogenedentes bacterium]|nr:hypothetical protein [Candidatus Hydrogenedentota bacterium]
METPSPDKLDALIEASLQDEAMLEVPLTLHRRIQERVQYAALHDQECRRFRFSFLWLGVACAAILIGAGAIVAVVNLDRLIRHGAAGWRGVADSFAMQFHYSWSPESGAFLLFGGLGLAAMTLLLAFLPRRKGHRRREN